MNRLDEITHPKVPFQEMEMSANTFIDELVNCSGKNFVGDAIVKDKVCRFTFEIMLRCLMGDSSDIQTRKRF